MCRYIAKTEFVLGTIQLLTDTLDLNTEAHVIEKSARVFAGLESLKALALAAEAGAIPDGRGFVLPAPKPLMAANLLFPKLYPEMIEILQLLGSSGVIMIPQEEEFQSDIAPSLNIYLKGNDMASPRTQRSVSPDLGAWGWIIRGQTDPIRTILFGNVLTVSNRLFSVYNKDQTNRQLVRDFLFNTSK
ncbi:4-hydroxyphenylacetate 3-hydroxylase C-terminal domain-containing protein [Paenibacillus amylolyticus]|nr:4-hydroxyphenylacetate 3-hydroxylase C-terminal domain-containing protein [Paenibacillus amylolyticus]